MNRVIEWCFSVQDRQLRKYGTVLGIAGVVIGILFIACAGVIVVKLGLGWDVVRNRMTDVSQKLLAHANASSTETVVATEDTAFLKDVADLTASFPFIAGLLIACFGGMTVQCGVLFLKLTKAMKRSSTTGSAVAPEGGSVSGAPRPGSDT